jgi:hypothetical protein
MLQTEDLLINYENLLKLGYVVVDIRYKDYDVLPESQKLIIAKVDNDRDEFYTAMLKQYTGSEFKPNEVYDVWSNILKHKINMSSMLNRDIAIKVAALDYFETIYLKK